MDVCLSVPRLRGTNAAGLSATSALHQSRVVFAGFDVMLRCIAHVKGEWDRLASSWVAISGIPLQLNCDPINGSFGTIADICNYRRRKAVAFSQAAPGVAFRRAGMSRFDLGFQTASAVQCVDLHEYHIYTRLFPCHGCCCVGKDGQVSRMFRLYSENMPTRLHRRCVDRYLSA